MSRVRRPRLAVVLLEDRTTPAIAFAAGTGAGVPNAVSVYSDRAAAETASTGTTTPDTVTPFADGFTGGVRVAVGDVTGDGRPDIVAAAGPGGGPAVAVFDGQTQRLVGRFFAFDPAFTGGVSVAVADVTGDGTADIVVGAGAGGGPAVKVFAGGSFAEVASFFAFDPGFTGGVAVAAADVDYDGRAEIVVGAGAGGGPRVRVLDGRTLQEVGSFLAFDEGFRGGVNVAAGDLGGDGRVEVAVGAGAGGGAVVRTFAPTGEELSSVLAGDPDDRGGATPAVADLNGDRFDDLLAADAAGSLRGWDGRTGLASFAGHLPGGGAGASLGGASAALVGLNGPVGDLPAIPVLERFGRYNPGTGAFDSVTAGSITGSANVYVLVHGWAPGYADWVNDYYYGTSTLPATGQVLKVWQTDPSDPNYATISQYNVDDLQLPAGAFIFQGQTGLFGTVVSSAGLASVIHTADPTAVVLAYSWLDESATDAILNSVTDLTGDVNVSESYTTENGLRLAQGLTQLLAPGDTGKVHLLGHSHGSKVATVAALELQSLGRPATQLTVMDSPEDSTTQRFEAANFNWYFLQSLTTARNPAAGGTFVDNYISEFGEPYSPFLTAAGINSFANIVDVTLDPGVIFPLPTGTDVGESHSYAATWYAGTSQNDGAGGLAFSPLLHAPPTTPLAAQYAQDWGLFSLGRQYTLDETVGFPPLASEFPLFTPITFDSSSATGTVSGSGNPSVSLSDAGGPATWTGRFDPTRRGTAIAFDYQFTAPGNGDVLTISVDGNQVFTMTGTTAGTGARTAILSTGVLDKVIFFDDTMTITLTGPGSAAATVGNFRLVTV